MQIDLEKVIDSLTDKETIETEELTGVAETLYKLIPPYTYYHYRLLHDEVKNSSEKGYKNKDYYKAFQEAMKRYKDSVKCKSNVNVDNDLSIMANSFGEDKLLKTTKKYVKDFAISTLNDIEEGQKFLSMGVVKGGRNPISHEECQKLKDTGLFTEKDCLDMLSILSHLFRRLDEC